MKLAFSTLGCPGWSWGEIVATAKDLGFVGIEPRGVQNETVMPNVRELRAENVADTRRQLENLGLTIPCITAGCRIQDEADEAQILAYIETAAALGTPYVRLLADDTIAPEKDVDEDAIVKQAKKIAPHAQKHGVTILLETNGAFSDSKRLKALLERIDSANFGALWDIHHTYRFGGEAPVTTVKRLGNLIKHVHCKDSIMKDGKLQYRIMGQGDVPVRNAVICLQDIGYMGQYCLEWVKRWDLTLEEPGIAFAQYLKYMKG